MPDTVVRLGHSAVDRATCSWYNVTVKTTDRGSSRTLKNNTDQKCILRNVSGIVHPGEFLALMGASGAGKTTLLNVLTHRNMDGLTIEGTRCINQTKSTPELVKSLAGYVQQEDLMIANLTVKEHLCFQAALKMSCGLSNRERTERVEDVLDILGLANCSNSIIGDPQRGKKGISGGEMKRLAFACEVITDPPVLFCDEPTSGLDSFMAQNVVSVMRTLARRGKTVICSIHQPSSEVYEMFDKVLFLAQGRTAYIGDASAAIGFFRSIGYISPNNCNPADFIIQTLAISHKNEGFTALDRTERITNAFRNSEKGNAMLLQCAVISEEASKSQSSVISYLHSDYSVYGRAGWWSQFFALFRRAMISNLREPMLLKVRAFQTVMVAVLFGVIFHDQKLTGEGVANINGALFLFLTSLTFQNVYSVINVFSAEMPIFLREHKGGLYRTDTYFTAKTLAELPMFVLFPCLFIAICYPMIGLNPSWQAFAMCMVIAVLTTNTVCSFGYMTSCASGNVSVALVVAAPAILPFLLFGGFFLNKSDVPPWLQWLQYLSWFSHANEALCINQWRGVTRIDCDPTGSGVCPGSGAQVLDMLHFHTGNFVPALFSLAALMLLYRLAALTALSVRARCQ